MQSDINHFFEKLFSSGPIKSFTKLLKLFVFCNYDHFVKNLLNEINARLEALESYLNGGMSKVLLKIIGKTTGGKIIVFVLHFRSLDEEGKLLEAFLAFIELIQSKISSFASFIKFTSRSLIKI